MTNMKFRFLAAVFGLVLIGAGYSNAQVVEVVGGKTSVALNFDLLESAASLELSSVTADVIAMGTLDNSVAFPINSRTADTLPTTFAFDPADFTGTLSGAIEHKGSVLFNMDTVEVGDFKIEFDTARTGTLGGAGTGFYVASTTGIQANLFDVVNLGPVEPSFSGLTVGADLAVSPEFGSFLFDNGLSASNLEGAVVGAALIEGVVPEPSPGLMLLMGVIGIGFLRRR